MKSPKVEKSFKPIFKPTQNRLATKSIILIKSVLDNSQSSIKSKEGLSKAKVSQGTASNDGVSTKSENETKSTKAEKPLLRRKPSPGQLGTKSSTSIRSVGNTKDNAQSSLKDKQVSIYDGVSTKSENETKTIKAEQNLKKELSQGPLSTVHKSSIKAKEGLTKKGSPQSASSKKSATTKSGTSANIEKWLSRAKQLKDTQARRFWKKNSPVDLFREAFKPKDPSIQPNKETKTDSPNSHKNPTSSSSTAIKDSFESVDPDSSNLDNKISDDTIKAKQIDLVASGSSVVNSGQTQSKHVFSPDSINVDFNEDGLSLNKAASCHPKPEAIYYGLKSPEDNKSSEKIDNKKNNNNTVESLLLSNAKSPYKPKPKTYKPRPITIGDIIAKLRQRTKSENIKAKNIQSLTESGKFREESKPGKGNPTKSSLTGTPTDEFSKNPVSDNTCDQLFPNSITSNTIASKRANETPFESSDIDQSYLWPPSQSVGNSDIGNTITSYPKTQCVASDEIQIHSSSTNADVTSLGKFVNVDQNDILDTSKIVNKEPTKITNMSTDDFSPDKLYNSKTEGEYRTADMLSVQVEEEPLNLMPVDKTKLGPKIKLVKKLVDDKKVQNESVQPKPKPNPKDKEHVAGMLNNRGEKGLELEKSRSDKETESQVEEKMELFEHVKDEKKQIELSSQPKRKLTLTEYLFQFLKGQRNSKNEPGRRNITTSAAQCQDTDADNYRLKTFISPDVKKHGMDSSITRRQRKSTEANPTKFPRDNRPNIEKPTIPKATSITSDTDWNVAPNPSPDEVLMGSKKSELNKNLNDRSVDATNMPDGSPLKFEDKSPIHKEDTKKETNNIEIKGGSRYCLMKLKAVKGIGIDNESGKRRFSALGRQLSQNIVFAFFRTDKNAKDRS
ncbi:uncharacterized protein Dmoj_GI26318, isoform C [Drosophila mojavensis]|uniref:Uncharacterized protein, isoform C n=2 Tax=Drosophila mojavensis TaxID=7230 RepID=A0A0Q9WZN0_DROMO|nr:uncharacterized protein Dmoj_GI26318, isoform C [Drosophila mojavensis]